MARVQYESGAHMSSRYKKSPHHPSSLSLRHEGRTCQTQRAIVGVARRTPAWWHSWPLSGQPDLQTLSPGSPPHTLTRSTLTRPHPSHPQPCIWWAPHPSARIQLLAMTRRLDLTLVFVVLPVLHCANGLREQIRRCAWTPTRARRDSCTWHMGHLISVLRCSRLQRRRLSRVVVFLRIGQSIQLLVTCLPLSHTPRDTPVHKRLVLVQRLGSRSHSGRERILLTEVAHLRYHRRHHRNRQAPPH